MRGVTKNAGIFENCHTTYELLKDEVQEAGYKIAWTLSLK